MDITRRLTWRTCGWVAAAMYVCILAIIGDIAIHPHAPRALDALAVCLAPAATLLTAIRLFAPPLSKITQKVDVNLGLQRRVLGQAEPADRRESTVLHLVRPFEAPQPQNGHTLVYMPQHKRERRAVSE